MCNARTRRVPANSWETFMEELRASWAAWRWDLRLWRRCPILEAEGQPGGERKLRTRCGPGELGPDTRVPDDAGRELVPQADFGPDRGRIPTTRRLLGEDVADERGAREARSADRIARA
jgi:hypothetical protein